MIRLSFSLLLVLPASLATAQPLTAKLANLIPPDARLVRCINVQRYQQSELRFLYPFAMSVPGMDNVDWSRNLEQVIIVEPLRDSDGGQLTILSGSFPPPTPAQRQIPTNVTLLDPGTAVFGDPKAVQEAINGSTRGNHSALADEALQMSESYDSWFIAVRPLEALSSPEQLDPKLKFKADLIKAVEEVRGGVRFGSDTEVTVEVQMNTVDDATALAALGRWLPGFIQMQNANSAEAVLAQMAENLTVNQSGNSVSLSFTLDEHKLDEFVRSQREPQPAAPLDGDVAPSEPPH